MLVLAKFAKDKPAVLGAAIVLLIAIVAVLGPLLAPYPADVSASHLLLRLKPPTWAHPFGTDDLGRDIFSRVILGARRALTIALMVVGISMLIGVPLGLVAGYYQGWASEAIMRVTDVFLAVPQLILALALAQLMGPSPAERHAGAHPHLLAVLHPHRLRRGAAPGSLALHRCAAMHRRARPAHHFPAHPAELHLAHHRARHHRHGLHHPGRGGAGLPRHRRHAA